MNREVFIIGAKGIPAQYGGFESFVEQLTERKKSKDVHYYVACRRNLSENKADVYEYNGATCFNVTVPNVGAASAILYDINAFKSALKLIEEKKIKRPIVYVLACRMGPFIHQFKKKLMNYDGQLIVNPDGHEWLRAKWSPMVRKYWKFSERLMVKYADLLICDSQNIQKYIENDYRKYQPETVFISYGSDIKKSNLSKDSDKVKSWRDSHGIVFNNYFLIVGRFVPENNYETMIKEFMKTPTSKDLVIISNVEHNDFYEKLQKSTNFESDKRIKFVGTVYDAELLKVIRENAFAYIHGHEVGGTNPSLLEALGSTKLNLLLDVGFNKEVGGNGAEYWTKDSGKLSKLIKSVENRDNEYFLSMEKASNDRILKYYTWDSVVLKYEKTFIEE
ncbi:beta 1-4 rhamnosyltransferase Cps2T [Lactiplantibacillus herbarum]|uniref:beta 1-4 rhamnosyltransferase Cps2T n=1 Tax=Lactiplantibacillus herbarum TaxID=1670446 RepID=UPI00064F4926|nr:DUF1972 domain-containing protein [Lactiplantibacillus herbarum]